MKCPACPDCANRINGDCIARNPLIRTPDALTMSNDYCSHYERARPGGLAVTDNTRSADEEYDATQYKIENGGPRGLRLLRPADDGISWRDCTILHETVGMFIPAGPLSDDDYRRYALGLAAMLRREGFSRVEVDGVLVTADDCQRAPRLKALKGKRWRTNITDDGGDE